MTNTAWMIADIDVANHVVPYTWCENGVARGPSWGGGVVGRY